MKEQEGGIRIDELLRGLGEEALQREAESLGLSPRAGRMRCPSPSCAPKGPTRERDARLFAGGHPRFFCHACNTRGDLVDLLQMARGFTREEAISSLAGVQVPQRPMPALQLVPKPNDSEHLSPADAKRIWDAMAKADHQGASYLEGRSLDGAALLDLVRFATEQHSDKAVSRQAHRGYRAAALLTDVVGNPRGIQLRAVRGLQSKDPKIISVKGSAPSKGFFGAAGEIEGKPVVCVAEGLADTLALSIWVGDQEHVAVVGAAGKQFLPKLADELAAASIDIHGKLFVLFPQNDRPKNVSRREFVRLGQLLTTRGARVVMVQTDAEYKDLADWRHARPDVQWPPPELAKAYEPEPGDEVPVEDRSVLPDGCAVPIPAQVRAEHFAQDFTTLCTLLDDPMHREAVMGNGALTWCEMTWRLRLGARELSEVDLSTIRLGLEGQGRSTDGKPLKFSEDEVARGMAVIARRKVIHPVRDWLGSLKWDGRHRLDVDLPGALGHEAGGFPARLLRRWCISAVARAMRPGCKVDTVLVLVGAQGTRKSSFFAALGGEWFTDSPVNVGDKDGKLVMRRAWVVEWAELDAMRRARDQETIKAFLSARVDMFRKPYGRDVVEAPRHCVIVGTTNNSEFLHDGTGNRRFWPIEVRGLIDVDWVRTERDQLFAEALQLYRGNEQWWLTPSEEQELKEVNCEHMARDVWFDPVQDWIEGQLLLDEVTTAQVLHEVFDKDMDTWSDYDSKRVATVLTELGWQPGKRRQYAGALRRVYVRPK